jgi:hypothetical protein
VHLLLLFVVIVAAIIAAPLVKGCLKIVFLLVAALIGLAMLGSLFPGKKNATTLAATPYKNPVLTATPPLPEATPYVNQLVLRDGKYVDATSPEPTISPVEGENATAIADGQRDGRAFVAKVEGGPNSNGKATGYLDKREAALTKLYGKNGAAEYGIAFLGAVQAAEHSNSAEAVTVIEQNPKSTDSARLHRFRTSPP